MQNSDKSPNDLWESIGALDEEENAHVLTKLFVMYEQMAELDPKSGEVARFFQKLDLAITQTAECNLNRR